MLVSETGHSSRRVLIVDESQDSREVLKTALEHRGVQIHEASGRHAGLELARACCPDVIVLDVETVSDTSGSSEFDESTFRRDNALVLLGSTTPPTSKGDGGRYVVPKPYHYGPLVRKIVELLDLRAPQPASGQSGSRL